MASHTIKRAQTLGEELANTISHGTGALLGLAGVVPLIVKVSALSGGAPDDD